LNFRFPTEDECLLSKGWFLGSNWTPVITEHNNIVLYNRSYGKRSDLNLGIRYYGFALRLVLSKLPMHEGGVSKLPIRFSQHQPEILNASQPITETAVHGRKKHVPEIVDTPKTNIIVMSDSATARQIKSKQLGEAEEHLSLYLENLIGSEGEEFYISENIKVQLLDGQSVYINNIRGEDILIASVPAVLVDRSTGQKLSMHYSYHDNSKVKSAMDMAWQKLEGKIRQLLLRRSSSVDFIDQMFGYFPEYFSFGLFIKIGN